MMRRLCVINNSHNASVLDPGSLLNWPYIKLNPYVKPLLQP